MDSSRKIVFIGQAYPEKMTEIPFGRTRFYSWFQDFGISKEQLLENSATTALLNFFPGKKGGSDRVPTEAEIQEHTPRLLEFLRLHNPDVIVPIGRVSINAVLQQSLSLEESVGQVFDAKAFEQCAINKTIIPLPHPSGLNRWIYQGNHSKLLHQALKKLLIGCLSKSILTKTDRPYT